MNVTEKIRGFFATKKEKHSKADFAPILWWKVTKRWERSYVLVTGQQCANIQWMRDELTILGFWYITVRWWLNLETGGVASETLLEPAVGNITPPCTAGTMFSENGLRAWNRANTTLVRLIQTILVIPYQCRIYLCVDFRVKKEGHIVFKHNYCMLFDGVPIDGSK